LIFFFFFLQRSSLQEKDTIVRLLYNLGSKEEVEQYLSYFSSVDSQRFAVIKVGGAILENEIETLATSLAFLNKVFILLFYFICFIIQLTKNLKGWSFPNCYPWWRSSTQ